MRTTQCPKCRGNRFNNVVEHPTMVTIRCAGCGEVAAEKPFKEWCDEYIEDVHFAFADPGPGVQPHDGTLIARGSLQEIFDAVCTVANRGTSVLLVADAPKETPKPVTLISRFTDPVTPQA